MDVDRYLERIGVAPTSLDVDDGGPDRETVARLQAAHVRSVPFETLSVTGDPHGPLAGGVPSTEPSVAVEKIVDEGRGGWCFELNGAFAALLAELGASVDVLAARVVGDGGAEPPANPRITLVDLPDPAVVDVGTGAPMLRRPLPLDGDPVTDETGHTWQVTASERPDAEYCTRYREPGADDWTVRYVFRATPRERAFFAPTCEFLATAPESPFTDGPTLSRGTEDGHRRMNRETFERLRGGEVVEQRAVSAADWHDLLREEFDVVLPRE